MTEDRSQRKKRWIQGLLKPCHSNHDLSDRTGRRIASGSQLSFHPPLQTGSGRGFVRGLFGKIFKDRQTRSAGQSPNPVPMTSDGSAQEDLSQDPPPQIAIHSDANLVQDDSANTKGKLHNPKKRIERASEIVATMRNYSGEVQSTVSAITEAQSDLDAVDAISSLIAPLKVFNSIANRIADLHPYAKVVLGIFVYASQKIIDQENRDNAVRDLLKKLSEVYQFMTEDGRLTEISTMEVLFGKVARQAQYCADFIVHYAETKSAWERLGRNVFNETSTTIQSYNKVLDALMQQFRDHALRDIDIKIHFIVEDLDIKDMVYVDGAGRDTSKRCLPGTREHILSEIKTWIDTTGEDVIRVLWLYGTAGKGKSAIAHTIADWFYERGGPCAFFCFDRTREAERRHEKIFTTIARDLADRDPIIRRALASVVCDNNELRHTKDIMRQWREFILGPVGTTSETLAAPVLIVIDALDESGEASSREQILRVLAGKLDAFSSDVTQLPRNVRVLVTSRPLDDIHKSLHGALHIRQVSMDDNIYVSTESSERDIQHYVSTRLRDLRDFNDSDLNSVALKSDGLFEWARLACEYIKGTNMLAQNPRKRFEAVVAGTSGQGTRLLDDMYIRILEGIMPAVQREESMPIFCSVMGQILASLEPLSTTALTAMRQHFPLDSDRYEVDEVIRPLGSLLTGTTDLQTPVRPLHTSFYDFLTEKSRSNAFFVEVSSAQRDLAFASLRVMRDKLHFNICSLESSYLPNSVILDLENRVKKAISAELSYSCRFWGAHVGATTIELLLAEEVKSFFDGERLLFWLEAVALLKVLSGAVGILSCISHWLMGLVEYTDIVVAVRDTQRFVRTFGSAILHSTPHLYLSALPLAPIQSRILKLATKFPCTPRRVSTGHVPHWPRMEKILNVNRVTVIAISPDGRRIVCDSGDGAIHMWNMETGEALNTSQVGHAGIVRSFAISRDGNRIVSGSSDSTIRVWDAGTGKALGAPLRGHTGEVLSVAISPDGKRIVSGSADMNVRVWDMETGKALGVPLQGHTNSVTCIAISPDGKRIVSGSTLCVWDMNTGKALDVRFQGHTGGVLSVAVSPDGNRIVSGSIDNTIRVWDAITGKLFHVLNGHTNAIRAVAISPDGNSIVSGSHDNTIRVWDARTGEALSMPLQGHAPTVSSVAVSPDGNRLVSCSFDNTIRVWDADGRETSDIPFQGHTSEILSAAFSPDGNRIVSSSGNEKILVWDACTGKALNVPPLQGDTSLAQSAVISVNGNFIVSGSFEHDNTISVWNAMTGEALCAPLQEDTGHVQSVAISLDGKRVVSGSTDWMIRVWNVVTDETSAAPLRLEGHADQVSSVAISQDGNLVVSGSYDKTVRVWNAMTGEALGDPLLGHTEEVWSIAISRDGNYIVSGSKDNTIRVWDAYVGKALCAPLEGHTGCVQSVTISPDSKFIASGSCDKTIRVWNAMTGEALGAPLQGHTHGILSVAFSPDGKRIVSGSVDKTIRVWDFESLIQSQFPEAPPAIYFSSNPTHTLCSASSFLQDFSSSVSLVPTEEGWIVGPDGRLLLWIPSSLYPSVYGPGNTLLLVIPHDALQLDLSRFAHGMLWHKCRESAT